MRATSPSSTQNENNILSRRARIASLQIIPKNTVLFFNFLLQMRGQMRCKQSVSSRPHICHFFSTHALLDSIFLHTDLEQKWHNLRQNPINCAHFFIEI